MKVQFIAFSSYVIAVLKVFPKARKQLVLGDYKQPDEREEERRTRRRKKRGEK